MSTRWVRVKHTRRGAPRGLRWVAACASIVWLAGCAAEFRNQRPSQESARLSEPPGAVYSGWRVFEAECARCHASGATGTASAPDLLPRMRGLGPRQFVDLLLTRYEWAVQPAQPEKTTPEREAYIDDIVQRRKGAISLPEWQGEPRVDAHVIDLHAYLSARAGGTQGPGRPTP